MSVSELISSKQEIKADYTVISTQQEKEMSPTKVPDQITKKEKAIESQAIHHATIAAGQYIEKNELATVPMHEFNSEQFEGLIREIGRAYTKEAAANFWLFVNMNENKTKEDSI